MKLYNLLAKLTSPNHKALSVLGGLALVGAALTVAAPAASAQQIGFGVAFGGPRYVAPVPAYRPYGPAYVAPRLGYGYAPGYWDQRRAEEWRAHEDWARHHEFYGRPVPYRGY